MKILIDKTSPVARNEQIRVQVLIYRAAGHLQPGDELPSVRTVAVECGINAMTVSKAYRQLRKDNVVAIQRGKRLTVTCVPVSHSSLARLINIGRLIGVDPGVISQIMIKE